MSHQTLIQNFSYHLLIRGILYHMLKFDCLGIASMHQYFLYLLNLIVHTHEVSYQWIQTCLASEINININYILCIYNKHT